MGTAMHSMIDPVPSKDQLPKFILTPEQEKRAYELSKQMAESYWGLLSAARVIVHALDQVAHITGEAAALDRALEDERAACVVYARQRDEADARAAQPPGEPDWKHPKLQALLAEKARLQIELSIVDALLDDPNDDLYGLSDYEHPRQDRLRERLRTAQPPAMEITYQPDEVLEFYRAGAIPGDLRFALALLGASQPPGDVVREEDC